MISVALATYNGEKYLREQIDSILAQTIQDFELVVCDDCSTDSTYSLLQQYKHNDKRIKLFRNEQDLGVKKNFERAISFCKGDFIALCDQDDVWTNNHLEVLYRTIGNKDLSCGNALIVNKNLQSFGLTTRCQQRLDWIPKNDFAKAKSILFFRNPYLGSASMFRKSLVEKILPIPNGCNYHDSWIAFVACLNNGINYTNEILLNYRRTGENVSDSNTKKLSKYKAWQSCFIPNDRISFIKEVFNRDSVPISSKQNALLRRWLFIMTTQKALGKRGWVIRRIGKSFCMCYLLLNFKSIYSCRYFPCL